MTTDARACFDHTLPIKTVNESNGSHGHWSVKSERRNSQRHAVGLFLRSFRPPALPVDVTLTRISAGSLDEHDNLRGSMKSIVDEIAKYYGLPDNDKRFTWNYAQEKCKRGQFGVRITITARE